LSTNAAAAVCAAVVITGALVLGGGVEHPLAAWPAWLAAALLVVGAVQVLCAAWR
jgi:hypothetical protein